MKKIFILALAALGMLACTGQNDPSVPSSNGELSGVFSVSTTKKIHFSQGNLQYQASSKTWRFAEHQYDTIGAPNANASAYYDGWIDLFGWGTSGYNNNYPHIKKSSAEEYGIGTDDISGTNYDWGVYNKISNGGNKVGQWRTLTNEEWQYLLFNRPRANQLFGWVTMNGIYGIVLLPDEWKAPEGITFIPNEDTHWDYHNSNSMRYDYNIFILKEWSAMEKAGAVFLPAAGCRSRYDSNIIYPTHVGMYWTSTYAYHVYFDPFGTGLELMDASNAPQHDYDGLSVRLVKDIE